MTKTPHQKTIEQALHMYKETVSPSEKNFQVILSQIPEQHNHEVRRAVRSPYIWVTITQVVTVFAIVLVFLPSYTTPSYERDPFYTIDTQVDSFEQGLDTEDAIRSLEDVAL